MKKIIAIGAFLISAQLLLAGCGGCKTNKKHSSYSSVPTGLLEKIPSNKRIEGNVLVSCGMCNFMNGDNDCALAIKIGPKVLKVRGVGIDDHGDSHDSDGYCNVIKKTYVEGIVRNNTFLPTKMDVKKI
tara:strand:+ start:513 stop:899 length:387 start_codon:yes stop_codon:yes gene_type:complete